MENKGCGARVQCVIDTGDCRASGGVKNTWRRRSFDFIIIVSLEEGKRKKEEGKDESQWPAQRGRREEKEEGNIISLSYLDLYHSFIHSAARFQHVQTVRGYERNR